MKTTLIVPVRANGLGVVFSHGWGGTHIFGDLLTTLAEVGVTVASISQRGYGASTGARRLAKWPEDIAAAAEWLRARGLSVWTMGISTGGTMALVTAGKRPWVAGALAISPFASLRLMIHDQPSAYRELTRLFGRLRAPDFGNANALKWASRIPPRPAIVVHSRQDETVPFSHAPVLAAKTGAELWALDGGDHWLRGVDRAKLFRRIAKRLVAG